MTAQQWNHIIIDHAGSFLQSWEWGEFQAAYGRPVERIYYDQSAMQIIVHTLPAGRTFLFSPYGPVHCTPDTASQMLDAIQQLATRYKAIFWRYERYHDMFGGRHSSTVHPEHTAVVQLTDPDTMLAHLKPKWRYNIRLAKRKGVKVRRSIEPQDISCVYDVLAATAKRQGIRIHPPSYYQLMLEKLGPAGFAQLYLAEYEAKIIAANLMIGFGKTMTYVHGGSDSTYRQLMAPHLLQWSALCDAYIAGYKEYDFFGVAPPDQPEHPWSGITRFKLGFGATRRSFDGTWEVPLQAMWYNAYTIVKRVRPWI